MFRTSIKIHNFVTFYEFLIHLGVHHTSTSTATAAATATITATDTKTATAIVTNCE
jgi:hypothetical protein